MPDSTSNQIQPALNPLERLINLEPGEIRYVAVSILYFFFLLSGYYILRPIREMMGLIGGVDNLPWLYLATMGSMLVLNPLFALLVGRFPRRIFVPVVYIVLLLNLLVFLWLFFSLGTENAVIAGRVFYVWVSVFGLFITSMFWSTMADIFRSGQSKIKMLVICR